MADNSDALAHEWKRWQVDRRSTAGRKYRATPVKDPDSGKISMEKWMAIVPGPPGSLWEGAKFILRLEFPSAFPAHPPKVRFVPPLFHPNCYASGAVCLSVIDAKKDWDSTTSVLTILESVSDWFSNINNNDPAGDAASVLYAKSTTEYNERAQEEAHACREELLKYRLADLHKKGYLVNKSSIMSIEAKEKHYEDSERAWRAIVEKAQS